MEKERSYDGGFSERGAIRPRLLPEVSSRSFSIKRLEQLWRLQGRHLRDFIDVCVRDDVLSKKHLQSYAVASMPSVELEITGDGPDEVNMVVGWMRARYEKAYSGDIPFAHIEEVYVDPAVEASSVEDFLVQRLQERVRMSRSRIAGLRVHVPGDDQVLAEQYLRRGFDYTRWDHEAFVWTPY